jgi:hypothetical protein
VNTLRPCCGPGIVCLSKLALRDAFEKGRLITLKTPSRDFNRQLYFIIHQQKYRSVSVQPCLKLFIGLVVEIWSQLKLRRSGRV